MLTPPGRWRTGRGARPTASNLLSITGPYGLLTQFETQKNWEVSHTINFGRANINNFRFGYLDAQAPQGAPAPPAEAVSAPSETGVFTYFTSLQQSWPGFQLL